MFYISRWKITAILATTLFVCLCGFPNFLSEKTLQSLPTWAQRHIVLGLDLQGGSHILLEVDSNAVRKEKIETLRDDVRRIVRENRLGSPAAAVVRGSSVEFRPRQGVDLSLAMSKLRELAQPLGGLLSATGQRSAEVVDVGNGIIRLTPTEPAIIERIRQSVEQSIQIVERRVNELGTVEPSIQRQGVDRILVQVPGLQDPSRLKELLGKTAKMTFRLVDTNVPVEAAIQGRVPPDDEVLKGTKAENFQPYVIEKRVMVSGEDLVDAQPGFDQRTNEPIDTFRFDTQGAKRFAVTTQQNVGRPFAIVLDGQVISAPVIREPILGGTGQISGGFTVQEANDLSILLRAGALPAKLTIVEERTVGPGLGADSIAAGKIAAIIGTVAVVVFMVVAYGLFGIFAVVALFANLALIVGVLSMLQATLTLPGIAGIVLTVGMAVDSNVLIFERIREELRSGKSAIASIDAGFTRALGTILDANITTLIAAVILFQLGSGPIRGFAVTLAIGIITTVFTAFTLSRLIIATWVKQARPSTVPI